MGHHGHKNDCSPASMLMGKGYASGGNVPIRGMSSDAIPGEAKGNPMMRAMGGQMANEDKLRPTGTMHGRSEMSKEDHPRGFRHGGNPHKARRRAAGGDMSGKGVNTGSGTAVAPADTAFAAVGAAKTRKGYTFT